MGKPKREPRGLPPLPPAALPARPVRVPTGYEQMLPDGGMPVGPAQPAIPLPETQYQYGPPPQGPVQFPSLATRRTGIPDLFDDMPSRRKSLRSVLSQEFEDPFASPPLREEQYDPETNELIQRFLRLEEERQRAINELMNPKPLPRAAMPGTGA